MAILQRAARVARSNGGKAIRTGIVTRRRIASAAAPATHEYPHHDLPPPNRRETIKNAKPFSSFLTDTFQRQHNYLRISLTEKCNLRCLYCMPEEGVPQSPPEHLLTTPEIYLLSSVFVQQGVTKIRLTGGEPTIRRDILPLMHQIGSLRSQGLRELCLTTNGITLHRKLDSMVEAGLTGVNLSLDTLDANMFTIMTRRTGFKAVMKSIERILEMNRLGAGIKLKINCVVMRGLNEQEILPFVELGREQDLEVRFIEYMPFDGNKWSQGKMLPYNDMLDIIRAKYPSLRKVRDQKNDTSKTFEIPGFVGRMGFITSMTHNFCGSCNRLRITSDGNLKVCLFGNAEVSLRDILRKSNDGNPINEEAFEAMKRIEMDRRQGITPQIPLGGTDHERELLDVIGLAVSRKKAKHAGMGELENMKNRPMVLIDEPVPSQRSLKSKQPLSSKQRSQISLWQRIPHHVLPPSSFRTPSPRLYSANSQHPPPSTPPPESEPEPNQSPPTLTHLTPHGTAHIVPITSKPITHRKAIALCTLHFSNATAVRLIRENGMKKGDVLSVARIAGIMGGKRTSEIIPLCHNIALSFVGVELDVISPSSLPSQQQETDTTTNQNTSTSIPWQGTGQGDAYNWHTFPNSSSGYKTEDFGKIHITAEVHCDGKTGVEMEALMAASVAGLTVYDMCKAVDKGMWIDGLRVVRKEGGKSGRWVEGVRVENGQAET